MLFIQTTSVPLFSKRCRRNAPNMSGGRRERTSGA